MLKQVIVNLPRSHLINDFLKRGPRFFSSCGTELWALKGNQEEKREPGGLGKILDNSAKKASLYLEEIKEVNPVSLRLNEFG